ncbi:hypothetical protein HYW21_05160 [Candidatus Woesearchaeota archaeon]|nr:hypothetical protein [Candidatus Woesearchaeota archaeon]
MRQRHIDFIRKTTWYNQGGETKFFYMTAPINPAIFDSDHGYETMMAFCFNGHGNWGLYIDGLERLSVSILQNLFSEKDYSKRLVKEHDTREEELDKALQRYVLLEKHSDEELRLSLANVNQLYSSVWKPFIFIDSFDLCWEEQLQEIMEEEHTMKLSKEEIKTLLLPDEMSYTQEEEVSLLKIKLCLSKKTIEQHQQEFFWYTNNYGYIEIEPVSHFLERLQHLSNAKERLTEINKRIEETRKAKQMILKKYNLPPKTLLFLQFMALLAKRRDMRKRCQAKGNVLLKRFLQEIGRRRSIDYHLFEQLSAHTIVTDLFSKKEKELKAIGNKSCGLYDYKQGSFVWYGKDAEEIKAVYDAAICMEGTEIKGMPACNGKARGRVRVIISIKDFSRMKQGEILVTYNTRPEFVPIMKKAGAIVTEEGGITCHAAVVSRELGVPCIVGVKAVTQRLKDNDLVEVDATNGVVKKLV